MIDPRLDPELLQPFVGEGFPRGPDLADGLLGRSQTGRPPVPVRPFDFGLGTQPRRLDAPGRGHQVGMVVPLVPVPVRGMDRHIHRHPVPIRNLLAKIPHQPHPLLGAHLVRQRQLVLPRHSGVTPVLSLLRRVPQLLPIPRPVDVRSCALGRQHDLCVLDTALAGVVEGLPGGLIVHDLGGAIGGGRGRRAPAFAADGFDRQVIDRHPRS